LAAPSKIPPKPTSVFFLPRVLLRSIRGYKYLTPLGFLIILLCVGFAVMDVSSLFIMILTFQITTVPKIARDKVTNNPIYFLSDTTSILLLAKIRIFEIPEGKKCFFFTVFGFIESLFFQLC